MLEEIVGLLGASFLTVFGWAFSMSNRLTAVETEYDGLKELIEVKFEAVEERLERIENMMNGD